MDLLRSDVMVALDDVQVACQRARETHLTVAGAVGDAGLGAYLRAVAEARAQAAEWLVGLLRREDDIPHKPAEELELLKKVSVWTQSLLHAGDSAILQQSRDEELRLESAAVAALELPMDDAWRDGLTALLADAREKLDEMTRRIADAAGRRDEP